MKITETVYRIMVSGAGVDGMRTDYKWVCGSFCLDGSVLDLDYHDKCTTLKIY